MRLDEAAANIGMPVVYTSGHHKEYGVIMSVNEYYVFVRYGTMSSSNATRPMDLKLMKEVNDVNSRGTTDSIG